MAPGRTEEEAKSPPTAGRQRKRTSRKHRLINVREKGAASRKEQRKEGEGRKKNKEVAETKNSVKSCRKEERKRT